MTTDNSLSKVGGICSILLAISYIVVGVTYLLLPAAQQQPPGDPAQFLTSFSENPTPLSVEYLAFALGAVFAFAAIPAISELVRSGNEGWVRWMSGLAYLGFAVTALNFFRLLALVPAQADAYAAADSETKLVIVNSGNLGLDPQGWLLFGSVGLWVLVVSWLALRKAALPKLWAVLGIAVAIAYGLVVAGYVLEVGGLITIAAGLGGIILGPIWYIWVGVLMYRPQAQAGGEAAPQAATLTG